MPNQETQTSQATSEKQPSGTGVSRDQAKPIKGIDALVENRFALGGGSENLSQADYSPAVRAYQTLMNKLFTEQANTGSPDQQAYYKMITTEFKDIIGNDFRADGVYTDRWMELTKRFQNTIKFSSNGTSVSFANPGLNSKDTIYADGIAGIRTTTALLLALGQKPSMESSEFLRITDGKLSAQAGMFGSDGYNDTVRIARGNSDSGAPSGAQPDGAPKPNGNGGNPSPAAAGSNQSNPAVAQGQTNSSASAGNAAPKTSGIPVRGERVAAVGGSIAAGKSLFDLSGLTKELTKAKEARNSAQTIFDKAANDVKNAKEAYEKAKLKATGVSPVPEEVEKARKLAKKNLAAAKLVEKAEKDALTKAADLLKKADDAVNANPLAKGSSTFKKIFSKLFKGSVAVEEGAAVVSKAPWLTRWMGGISKASGWFAAVGGVIDGFNTYSEVKATGGTRSQAIAQGVGAGVGTTVGGIAGIWAGAAAGAAIGTLIPVPVVGTVVGFIAGGLVAWGCASLGGAVGRYIGKVGLFGNALKFVFGR
jgi:hypothetical protein